VVCNELPARALKAKHRAPSRRWVEEDSQVTDIFREVEEEVRRERIEQIWKRYGDYIIAGVALAVIAMAAFELWRVYEQKQLIKASDEYSIALQLTASGQPVQAAEIFGKLAASAPAGYRAVSRLQQADAMMTTGNRADAIAIYRQMSSGSDLYLAAIAKIHLGWAVVDRSSKSDMESLLSPLLAAGNAWSPLARELIAYAEYRAGDAKAAISDYQSIIADQNSPQALRQRALVMAAFLKAGGDKNYGIVPSLPAPAAPTPSTVSAGAGAPQAK
jgi:hypothetical protein